jgi:hypothetical protein
MTGHEHAKYVNETPTITGEEIRQIFLQYQYGGAGAMAVHKALARHPSLPPDIACWLVTSQPEALAENPALALLLIESPFLFQDRPAKKLRHLLHRENVSPLILQSLLGHKDKQVRGAAQYHIGLAGECTEGWEQEAAAVLVALVPANPTVLREMHFYNLVPEWLVATLKLKAKEVKYKPAPYTCPPPLEPPAITEPAPTQDTLQKIKKMDEWERYKLADNEGQHPDVLRYLAHDEEYMVYNRVTGNPNIPIDVIEYFITDSKFENNYYNPMGYLAINLYISTETINRIALNGYINENTINRLTSETLYQLLTAGCSIIYAEPLSKRPDLTVDMRRMVHLYLQTKATQDILRLVSLSQIESLAVLEEATKSYIWVDRFASAINPVLPKNYLTKLSRDGNRFVRAAAKARLADSKWRFAVSTT